MDSINASVIIPVYNAAPFLEKAVESALKHPEVQEIILVEDGSKDNSLEVAQKLASQNSKIKLFQHPNGENRGAGASRNVGIDKATQEFIAFLDADDVFTDLRFTAENKYFQNPNIEGVFGAIGVQFLSEKGKKDFEEKFKQLSLTTVKYEVEGPEIFEGLTGVHLRMGTFFSLIGLTLRKKVLDNTQLRFNEKLRVHQDSDFITKLAFHSYLKSGIIDKAVALRGVHDDNRITKIVNYSETYNSNQLLLWKSLYHWQKPLSIPSHVEAHIRRKYFAFEIGTQKGISKWISMLKYIRKDPMILKTRYRFHFSPKTT